jgi:Na+/H+-dicarboxylate symporter
LQSASRYQRVIGGVWRTLTFFGSIFAGLAAASLPSAAGVAVIAIVLEPLGLPVEVAIVLLIAIDPILDPINAAVDTHVACTVATLVADPPTKDIE